MRPRRGVLLLGALLALPACVSFVPLREPPALQIELPPGSATNREEVIARFGPPAEVRASDLGPVLVYRRPVVTETTPSRYYGEDRGTRLDRYQRVLLYLDEEGRIVRTAIEPEE
jgi:hypothetical protein